MKDYYRILQITSDASQEEVKKAYRRLAKVHHPDVAGGVSTREELLIQELNEAYRTLGHPDKRSHYDYMRTNRKAVAPEDIDNNPLRYHSKIQTSAPLREEEPVQPYLKYTYTICKVALAFCLLLALDFFLPLKHRSEKAVYQGKVYGQNSSDHSAVTSAQHSRTLIKTWSGQSILVSSEAGEYFAQSPNLILSSSRLLGKARYVTPAAEPENRYLIGRSIYGNYIFLPIILLCIAAFGSFKRISPNIDFSIGVVSALLLLISMGLLLV